MPNSFRHGYFLLTRDREFWKFPGGRWNTKEDNDVHDQYAREVKEEARYETIGRKMDYFNNVRCIAANLFGHVVSGDPDQLKGDIVVVYIHDEKHGMPGVCCQWHSQTEV